MDILIKWIIIFCIIIILTFFQKYHFKMLFFLSNNLPKIFSYIFKFFIRLWIIIHELTHLIFWIISWWKVKNIKLFAQNWGQVQFETKNYIWAIWNNYHKRWFFLFLFFNQIWIFLTSIWPLILWLLFNYIIIIKLYWFDIELNNYILDYSIIYPSFVKIFSNFTNTYIFIIYILLLPSFILSFQDISNFIISKQENKLATFWWSIINSIIFISFILFLTLFYEIFLYFLFFYLIIFIVLALISLLVKIILILRKK